MRSRAKSWLTFAVCIALAVGTACGSDSSGNATAGMGGTGANGGDAGIDFGNPSGGTGSTPIGGIGGNTPMGGTGGVSGADAGPPCPEFSAEPGALPEIGLTVLLDTHDSSPYIAGVVDGYVYYWGGTTLRRVALSGGEAEEVGPVSGRPFLRGKDLLVWFEQEGDASDGPYRIVRAPLTDPADTTTLATNVPVVYGLMADDEYAYWSGDATDVFRVLLTGGDPEVFIPGAQPTGSLIHDGYFWWLDFQTKSLNRIGLEGGTPERLTDIHHGGTMAGEGDGVYWADSSFKAIEMWSPATGRAGLSSAEPQANVAVADGTVYWADGPLFGGDVMSIHNDGTQRMGLLCGAEADWIFVHDAHLVIAGYKGILRMNR